MSKRDELIEMYKKEMDKLGIQDVDVDLFEKVVIGCGPSIYDADSSLVSGSDSSELTTIKNNFLVGKLGLKDGPTLDSAIQDVISDMGTSNPRKYRAIFYYLLVVMFNKGDVYA